jgi:signal transduction histidine kinase
MAKRHKTMGYGLSEIAAALTAHASSLHPLIRGEVERVGGLAAVPSDMRALVMALDNIFKDTDEERVALQVQLAQSKREQLGASDELDSLLKTIPDLLLRMDAAGRVLDVRGGDPDNPLTGAPRRNLVSTVLPEEAGRRLMAAARGVAQSGGLERVEYDFDISGRHHWYEARVLPLRKGEVMAMVRDITVRVESERVRADRADQQARNEAMAQFAYIASHDLQAPLRAVDNLATWIEDDVGDKLEGESREHLRLLRTRVQRMQALIKGLLEFSRVGGKAVTLEETNSADLVSEVSELLGPPKGFAVSTKGSMPKLETSRDLLERVFLNLMTNAIKHHDKEQGSVEVSCVEGSELVTFRVQDDGPGIPVEQHERAFEMFKRLKTKDEDGVGMGLSLIRRIVEVGGGQIHIEAAEPRGTAFVFTWPRIWPS